ncbi:sulfatase-like hydrolase/transferase [Winogradskyella eckloniae]|uniref:sulfatase family protein n=1 Tax=Winogradskyella eckloniae TaxID=1089306 RepID=UPI001564B306|nr:sulfatase-like hydrolase/transferase [Winogradskyella eckloniae]NRD20660.1 sulfatase-like hydrolase/transferase [Winogradskyella eckloniae]
MKPYLYLIVFAVLFSCYTNKKNKESSTEETTQPNILLIVVDDQGYADFEPFDNFDTTVSTPNIARLGNTGTVYSQAYVTAPVCSPSRAGIITGKNQFRWDIPASWGPGLPENVKTLPEYLKEVGYTTARIGKNDLGRNFHKYDVREYPLNHGYDEFLGFSAHAHDYWANSKSIQDKTPDPYGTSAALGPLMHNMGEKSYEDGYLTNILTDESIAYLKRKHNKPFFLTISYSAVHHLIHEVPKQYLDKYNVKEIPKYDPKTNLEYSHHKPGSYAAYYDKYSRIGAINTDDLRQYYLANLNCLDDNIGRVLDALNETELDKNTLIVFISDNGGSPLTGANNAPLTGGKYALWEGGIRVPLAMSWPGHVEAGKIETQYVSATDILPTLTHAAGITLTDKNLDGKDLLEPKDNDRLLVWKWQKTWAVRLGQLKLTNTKENHWKSEPSAQYIPPIKDDLTLKLFNIETDPGERNDLSEKHPDIVEQLENAYKDWCATNIKN